MLTYKIYKCITLLLLLLLYSCNSNIFVDPVTVPEEMTLEGNGDSKTVRITKKGLTGIDFDNSIDYDDYVTYFDKDDQVLYEISDINEVARILYHSMRFAVEFRIAGDQVTVTALDNTYNSKINVDVFLYYNQMVKSVEITITPGPPLEINEVSYGLTPQTGTQIIRATTQSFTNNSSQHRHIPVCPYQEIKSKIEYTPRGYDDDFPAQGELSVPCYDNGSWDMFPEANKVNITIGKASNYFAESTNPDEVQYVEVPPYSKVEIQTSITIATLEVSYSALISMPNSGMSKLIFGECKVSQPIDFKIDVICEELSSH